MQRQPLFVGRRILLSIVLVAVVALLLSVGLLFSRVPQLMSEQYRTLSEDFSARFAHRWSNYMQHEIWALNSLYSLTCPEDPSGILDALYHLPHYHRHLVTDQHGQVVASSESVYIGYELGTQPVFAAAQAATGPFQTVYYSQLFNELVFLIVIPHRIDGTLAFVGLHFLDATVLEAELQNELGALEGELLLVSTRGVVYLHIPQRVRPQGTVYLHDYGLSIDEVSGPAGFIDLGQGEIMTYRALPDIDAVLINRLSMDSMNPIVRTIARSFLWVSVLSLLIFLVFLTLVNHYALLPFSRFSEQLRQVVDGQIETLPTPAHSDLAMIAESFNESWAQRQQHEEQRLIVNKLEQELQAAKRIHECILPKVLPDTPQAAVAAFHQEASTIGADLYDSMLLDRNRLLIYMMDVSGHGLDGALIATMVKTVITEFVAAQPRDVPHPDELLAQVRERFAQAGFPEDYFVCLFVGHLHLLSGEFSFCAAGFQVPFLILDQTGSIETITTGGLPISAAFDADQMNLHLAQRTLHPGQTILLFSDGLWELEPHGAVEDRINELAPTLAGQAPASICRRIQQELGASLNDPADDMTLLAVQFAPSKGDSS